MKSIKLCLLFIFVFGISFAQAKICINGNLPESDNYHFISDLKIKGHDGIQLSGNLLIPKGNHKGPFPTIIFVNSWLFDEHEYLLQAVEFVKKGYQVLSYSARGWGCSEGYVDVVGPNDMNDVRSVISYLKKYTKVDPKRIGMSGISYGGGMSLMAAGKIPEIKAVAVMSAWGSLTDALYHQQTPRLFWGGFLIGSGAITADLDPVIAGMFTDLLRTQDLTHILDWTKERSPINYIEGVNQRNTPVFIANAFGDNLFQVNNVLEYFKKLKSPRKLMMVQGTHATAEILGLAGFNNRVWSEAHKWFDSYLKGEGEYQDSEISLITDLERNIENYSLDEFQQMNETIFYLSPRSLLFGGDISSKEYKGRSKINTIRSGFDSRFNTGIPFVSALLDGNFSYPLRKYFPMIDHAFRPFGISFESQKLEKTLKLRGIPSLEFSFSTFDKNAQVIAYLYDVSPVGVAKLITHGAVTFSGSKGKVSKMKFDLVGTAYDLKKGHRLVLGLDTFDVLYAPPMSGLFSLDFHFGREHSSLLRLPNKL